MAALCSRAHGRQATPIGRRFSRVHTLICRRFQPEPSGSLRIVPARGPGAQTWRDRSRPDVDTETPQQRTDRESTVDVLGSKRRYALTINDPSPVQDVAGIWRSAVQSATIGMFVLIFIASLYFAHALVVPILAGVVVGATFSP